MLLRVSCKRYIAEISVINLERQTRCSMRRKQLKGEDSSRQERRSIKVYILEVKNTPKGPRILVSRTHPRLVRVCLTARGNGQSKDGKSENLMQFIARLEEAAVQSFAVATNNPNVTASGGIA